MSDFKDFLIERGLISTLMKQYGINMKDNEVNDFILKIVENLSKIDSKEIYPKEQGDKQRFDLDIIAKLYEKVVPHSQRKTMGEFFTPIHIVDYILKSVGYTDQHDIENKILIDLSCGSGSFLIRAVNVLTEKLGKQLKLKENSEPTAKQAKDVINKIKVNISGIDINPIACILCQINFYIIFFDLFNIILEVDKEYEIPVFNIYNKDTLQFNFNIKYDYVIGNPPYLFIRAIPQDYRKLIEKLPLETNKGQYDYYQLFLELGIKILKKNGLLGYIIPDSLLALSNRKMLRRYIYNSTKIREIYYNGPQFDEPVVSNIIITLEKESDEVKRKSNLIKIKFPLTQSQADNNILQNLIEHWDYEFLINLNENDLRILDHLNKNFPRLEQLIESSKFSIRMSRGVELGKEGKVIFCDNCNRFYPLPSKEFKCPECMSILNPNSIEKIIIDKIPNGLESNFKPFIYSMNRYVVNELKFIDITKKGINYKGLDIYKNRIVIRQISQDNMICATVDDYAITSQSYYNLKIISSSILEFNNKYLLGLLNSQLLSYYFIKSFGSYKKLFPRVLIEKLKALPLRVPITTNEKQLARNLGNKIINILKNVRENKEKINNLQRDSDLLVYDLFNINKKDRNYISNFINNLKK
ncbi:MAG: N-6 DNA methylase [Candidatus Lokiarchaeota archaeon]|nr:N-6 DNA methylase [Candidatus Lokiarchaeota archaeon]